MRRRLGGRDPRRLRVRAGIGGRDPAGPAAPDARRAAAERRMRAGVATLPQRQRRADLRAVQARAGQAPSRAGLTAPPGELFRFGTILWWLPPALTELEGPIYTLEWAPPPDA